jgi:hypothetical protein
MSRPTRIAVLAVLPFVVAVIGVVGLSRIGAEEQPPCRACVQPSSGLPQVSVCELANDAPKFAGTLVRVDVEFQNDAGQLFLKDGSCTMHAGFAREEQACKGAWQKLRVTCGVNTWYDGSASVRVVGSLSTIPEGNYYAGEEGFTVQCLEIVRTEPTFGQRIQFAIGRLF